MKKIELLDCTLRDGAYIVDAMFGEQTIKGIISNLQKARVDIIECGWLKDDLHKKGTSFFHLPDDVKTYLPAHKRKDTTYIAMIDYNRYDCNILPECDGKTIDAIRIVFPRGKVNEAVEVGKTIRNKGYRIYFQAANTIGYTDEELLEMIEIMNEVKPEGVSIVDTFGKMYPSDLAHLISIVDKNLDKTIKLGFHSHNNQQLSFALTMQFVECLLSNTERTMVIDSSLCGMGRGAGNTCTELIVNYLNNVQKMDYDLNVIMDTIDQYISVLMDKYIWGYSIPYSLAGMYGCHVNNVAYLTQTHRTKSKDMKIIFESLSEEKRVQYDYDNLEKVYNDYQNKVVDDAMALEYLRSELEGKQVVVILPGVSAELSRSEIKQCIEGAEAIVIGINAVVPEYDYQYLFFSNKVKYEYAKETHTLEFDRVKTILSSNIKTEADKGELIINYNDVLKRGWKYFDNSFIMFLRLMNKVAPSEIWIAGFDGYLEKQNKYANTTLKPVLEDSEYINIHSEIEDMLDDFIKATNGKIKMKCITESPFEAVIQNNKERQ